jgi:molybdopterin-guanine dinucleotide biosynthesis protein A
MGRDKAFVEVGGTAMVQRVAAALSGSGCRPVIAVGGDEALLTGAGLAWVPDRWPGAGPLGGILTALAATRADTVVLATDLPFADAAVVSALLDAAAARPDADVVIARSDRDEPLCALWRSRSTGPLTAAFDDGERAVHRAITRLVVQRIDIDPLAMTNVNRPQDLDAIRAEP